VPARAGAAAVQPVLREQRRRVEPRGRGARLLVESHGLRIQPLDQTKRAGSREPAAAVRSVAWLAGVGKNGKLGN